MLFVPTLHEQVHTVIAISPAKITEVPIDVHTTCNLRDLRDVNPGRTERPEFESVVITFHHAFNVEMLYTTIDSEIPILE